MKKNETIILDLQQCYRSPEELKHAEMIETIKDNELETLKIMDKKRIKNYLEKLEKMDKKCIKNDLEALKDEYRNIKEEDVR